MLKAFLLGLIQGIAEFLPISSSGHLVIAGLLLKIDAPGNTMEVLLHLGTLFSVSVCFYDKIIMLFKDFFSLLSRKKESVFGTKVNFVLLLIIATIPAVISGLFLDRYAAWMFNSPLAVGVALLFTAAALYYSNSLTLGQRTLADLTVKDALIIGMLQAIAVVPGISRAGMSITGGMLVGLSRKDAAEWSFLMSLPVIAGAVVLKIPDVLASPDIQMSSLIVGILTAFIFGIIAIKTLMNIIQTDKWKYFAYYCMLAGAILVIANF